MTREKYVAAKTWMRTKQQLWLVWQPHIRRGVFWLPTKHALNPIRLVSVKVSSEFYLYLMSCHISVFDDVARFLIRERISALGTNTKSL